MALDSCQNCLSLLNRMRDEREAHMAEQKDAREDFKTSLSELAESIKAAKE